MARKWHIDGIASIFVPMKFHVLETFAGVNHEHEKYNKNWKPEENEHHTTIILLRNLPVVIIESFSE